MIQTATQRSLLLWLLFGLTCLPPILTHTSDNPTILGRYSTGYALVVGGMLALVLLSLAAWLLAGRVPLRVPRLNLPLWGWALLMAVGAGLIAAIWLLLPVSSALGGSLFRIYLMALVSGILLALVHRGGLADVPISRRGTLLLTVGIVAMGLLLGAIFLGRVPGSHFIDEPWLVAWGQGITDPALPLDPMMPTRDLQISSVNSTLTLTGLGYWTDLFGIGYLQGRSYSLILGWLSLPFLYLIARRFYGLVGAITVLAVGLPITLHHAYIYPTTWVALTTAAALFLYVSAWDRPHGTWWRHVLAGVVVAAGVEGHPYAVIFVIGFGAVYLLDAALVLYHERRLHWPLLWLILGGVLYGVIWVGFRIGISDGTVTLTNLFEWLRASYSFESDLNLSLSPGEKTLRFYENYLQRYPPEFLLLLAGGIGLLVRVWRQRDPFEARLLLLLMVSFGSFTLIMAKYHVFYWSFCIPFVTLLAAGLIGRMPGRVYLSLAGLSAVLFVTAALTTFNISIDRRQNVDDLLALGYEIHDVLPAEIQSVAGWEWYYFGLNDRIFMNTLNFSFEPDAHQWGVLPPQAVILTQGLDASLAGAVAYIEAENLQLAYCFPLYSFGRQADLYLPADLLPPDAPINCPA